MHHTSRRDGDLLLLMSLLLEPRCGTQLELRWEGPYFLSDLAWHGTSGRAWDFNMGEVVMVKKRALHNPVHMNDLKVYLRRSIVAEVGVMIVDILMYEKRVMIDLGTLGDIFSLERTEAGGRRSVESNNGAQRVG